MANTGVARFSMGKLDIKDAPNFHWEYPVPVNDFWDTLKYPSARNFLTCFSTEEVEQMNLEQYGSLSNDKKAEILIKILRERIASKESRERPLYIIDNALWQKLMMAIGTIYGESDQLDKQIEVAEELVEKRVDKSNVSHLHALGALLAKRGEYRRAEEIERQCTEYMDAKAGKDSPQSMSSRRIIAKAVWMQGRQSEAEKLIAEIFDLIEASGSGKFAVYQESERKMTEEMVDELKRGQAQA